MALHEVQQEKRPMKGSLSSGEETGKFMDEICPCCRRSFCYRRMGSFSHFLPLLPALRPRSDSSRVPYGTVSSVKIGLLTGKNVILENGGSWEFLAP